MAKVSEVLWDKCIIGLAEINKSGRFTKANPAFCNLLGYNEAELQDKTWEEITHPEDSEGSREMLARCFAGSIPGYTMESRYITKRQSIIWVNLHVTVVEDDKGDIKFLLKQVTTTPIILPTETKKTEKASSSGKENYKIIIAAAVGCIFTAYGLYFKHPEVQNIGTALIIGLFGGMMVKK